MTHETKPMTKFEAHAREVAENTPVPAPMASLVLGKYSVLRGARIEGWRIGATDPDEHQVLISGCVLTNCDLSMLRWEHVRDTIIKGGILPRGGTIADTNYVSIRSAAA